jgi:hypothetical protein
MKPSDVRARVLAEHAEIRAILDRLEPVARALRDGDHVRLDDAEKLREALCERLFAHIDLEDAILAPALRAADAWGKERAAQLLDHHREQRAELASLARVAGLEPAIRGARLMRLVEYVRDDMRHEEAGLLDAAVLRDDVVGVAVEDG